MLLTFISKLKHLCLIIASLLIALILCEIFSKYALGILSYNDLGTRYQIDKFYSFSPGFFRASKSYALKQKPHFNHIVSDNNFYPKQERIYIDQNGYRNQQHHANYDTVLVGDSFVFGFGESDSFNLSGVLSSRGKKVYNLGIVGAGPATYMKAANEFLKLNKVKKYVSFFYNC